jgi:hypothetical protein
MLMRPLRYSATLILTACALLSLAGCQTMSPTECKIANWQQMGQQDGSAGRREHIAQHIDSCSKQQVNVAANAVSQYRQGYQQGLQYYCTPAQVLDTALTGNSNISICPLATQAGLKPVARLGQRVHDARETVEQLDNEQQKLERELAQKDTPDARRVEIRRRLRDLDDELLNARLKRQRAELELNQYQYQQR